MKTFKMLLAIIIMAAITPKTMALGKVTGLYLTAEDYQNKKLSYTGENTSIKLNEFLASAKVCVVQDGKTQYFLKSEIFGYKCGGDDYRYFENTPYKILDTKDFFIYSAAELMQGAKGPKTVEGYYFSATATATIAPLSLTSLEHTFAGNKKFRYLIESYASSDHALNAYDPIAKEYKIKYLYEQSM